METNHLETTALEGFVANLRDTKDFSPEYKEITEYLDANPFSARSCRCHPGKY